MTKRCQNCTIIGTKIPLYKWDEWSIIYSNEELENVFLCVLFACISEKEGDSYATQNQIEAG